MKEISRVIDYLLSVRAHAPKSVWGADTEFSIAVTGILHLVGVEVNHLEFEAPEVELHTQLELRRLVSQTGEGISTLREVASVPSNTHSVTDPRASWNASARFGDGEICNPRTPTKHNKTT